MEIVGELSEATTTQAMREILPLFFLTENLRGNN